MKKNVSPEDAFLRNSTFHPPVWKRFFGVQTEAEFQLELIKTNILVVIWSLYDENWRSYSTLKYRHFSTLTFDVDEKFHHEILILDLSST